MGLPPLMVMASSIHMRGVFFTTKKVRMWMNVDKTPKINIFIHIKG